MNEIIKAFLKSLVDKKARTFLVLFSIAISAAIIFANEGFTHTVAQGFYDAGVRWSGNSDLYIRTQNVVGAQEWIDPTGSRLTAMYLNMLSSRSGKRPSICRAWNRCTISRY